MTGTVPEEPLWSLERRASSGHLVWKKESPNAKIRFRCDVEVLEYIKDPDEHNADLYENDSTLNKISTSLVFGATCAVAVAVTVFLPWYLMGAGAS